MIGTCGTLAGLLPNRRSRRGVSGRTTPELAPDLNRTRSRLPPPAGRKHAAPVWALDHAQMAPGNLARRLGRKRSRRSCRPCRFPLPGRPCAAWNARCGRPAWRRPRCLGPPADCDPESGPIAQAALRRSRRAGILVGVGTAPRAPALPRQPLGRQTRFRAFVQPSPATKLRTLAGRASSPRCFCGKMLCDYCSLTSGRRSAGSEAVQCSAGPRPGDPGREPPGVAQNRTPCAPNAAPTIVMTLSASRTQ